MAGANTMADGTTFVKIAWNPEFLSAPLAKTTPKFGLKIECPEGDCNGLPCAIDPSKGGVGGLDSPVATNGVGDAAFCVVTVPKGQVANIVVFNTDGSSEDKPSSSSSSQAPEPEKTSSAEETSSSAAAPPTSSAPSSSSAAASSGSSSSAPSSTTSEAFYGGIFQEVDVQGETSYYSSPSPTPQPTESQAPDVVSAASPTSSNEGAAAAEGGSAIAGLVVALIAAAALF